MKPHLGPATVAMVDAWTNVFSSTEPSHGDMATLAFSYPFAPHIESAFLYFPLDDYFFTTPQFAALKEAMIRSGEETYYVSTYEDEADFLSSRDVRGDPRHYVLAATDSIEEYRRAVPWPLEYALYAHSGKWGALISHEEHCILGGSREFIEVLGDNYSGSLGDLAAFEHYWNREKDSTWASELVQEIKKRRLA